MADQSLEQQLRAIVDDDATSQEIRHAAENLLFKMEHQVASAEYAKQLKEISKDMMRPKPLTVEERQRAKSAHAAALRYPRQDVGVL